MDFDLKIENDDILDDELELKIENDDIGDLNNDIGDLNDDLQINAEELERKIDDNKINDNFDTGNLDLDYDLNVDKDRSRRLEKEKIELDKEDILYMKEFGIRLSRVQFYMSDLQRYYPNKKILVSGFTLPISYAIITEGAFDRINNSTLVDLREKTISGIKKKAQDMSRDKKREIGVSAPAPKMDGPSM